MRKTLRGNEALVWYGAFDERQGTRAVALVATPTTARVVKLGPLEMPKARLDDPVKFYEL